jgi:hypothetical protein
VWVVWVVVDVYLGVGEEKVIDHFTYSFARGLYITRHRPPPPPATRARNVALSPPPLRHAS